MRANVEHPFRILKRIFGFDKVRCRGLAKNDHRLCANFALVNLYVHRKRPAVRGWNCVCRCQNRPAGTTRGSMGLFNNPHRPVVPMLLAIARKAPAWSELP